MNKLNINSKELLKASTLISGLVKGNHTMPILDNILLEISNNKMFLTADNLETRGRVELPVVYEGSISTCIPFKLFFNILKGFPNAPVEIIFEEKTLTMNSSTGNYNVPLTESIEFPEAKIPEEVVTVKFNALDLKEGLRKALLFTEKSNVTSFDNVLIGINKECINIASTDGGAIVFEYSLEGSGEPVDLVISRSVALYLTQSIAQDEEIELSYSSNFVFLKLENIEIAAILSDMRFPNYKLLFEKITTNKTLNIDKDVIASAIKRLYNITDESNKNVVLKINDKKLEISFNNDLQKYFAKETLDCEYAGDNIDIGFNANYINNVLIAIEEDIKMEMYEPSKPCLFTSENIRAILAPIKL